MRHNDVAARMQEARAKQLAAIEDGERHLDVARAYLAGFDAACALAEGSAEIASPRRAALPAPARETKRRKRRAAAKATKKPARGGRARVDRERVRALWPTKTPKEIAADLGCSDAAVYLVAKELNLPRRGPKPKASRAGQDSKPRAEPKSPVGQERDAHETLLENAGILGLDLKRVKPGLWSLNGDTIGTLPLYQRINAELQRHGYLPIPVPKAA